MKAWLGPARVLLRTRQAHRQHDPGAGLRALARGADKAVGLRFGGRHVLLVLDPELAGQLLVGHAAETVKGPGVQLTRGLLGNGLLTSEGEDHRRARRLIAPAFSPRRLAGYTETFARSARVRLTGWLDADHLDLHQEMAALTLEIVGKTLLGVDLSDEAPSVRAGLEAALKEFGGEGFKLPGLRRRVPAFPDNGTRSAIHEVVDRIVEQRRANLSDDRGDVISALLAASAEPDGLSMIEVHDELMTLLMAGHETTANALSWTLYLLGQHPDVQRKVQSEVDQLGGRPPTFADLPTLTYLRAVISEAIRLYPPAWIIGRQTLTDFQLDRWRLPAGSVVAVSPLLLHHDPRWFPEPARFDPQRWLDERREAVPRHAYLPFGTGPRACIGEQFAWTEAITVMAVLAQLWTVQADPTHQPKPQYRVTLRPANGMPMTVDARP